MQVTCSLHRIARRPHPEYTVKRALGLYPGDNQYYYFTAITLVSQDELVGIVMIGISMDTLLPQLKKKLLCRRHAVP
jgi:hypothetical protein